MYMNKLRILMCFIKQLVYSEVKILSYSSAHRFLNGVYQVIHCCYQFLRNIRNWWRQWITWNIRNRWLFKRIFWSWNVGFLFWTTSLEERFTIGVISHFSSFWSFCKWSKWLIRNLDKSKLSSNPFNFKLTGVNCIRFQDLF